MAQPTSHIAATLAQHPDFKIRVKFFMQKAAAAVIGEGPPNASVGRSDYATKVLNGSASISEMAIAVSTNSTISAAIDMTVEGFGITDNDLEFTVNSMWDDFSRKEGDAV